jgi:hypothetical protein
MKKRNLTPREKKELSYARDGRNTYGESRRSSEKAIARRKAKANRAFRRAEAHAVAAADADADADVFVPRAGRRSWRKVPDAPLGEYVAARLESREAEGMNTGDKRSDTLAAGRKRARVRLLHFMGGFYRGQNRAAARLRARAAGDDQADDNR